jgi:transcriptional regulator with PAS, ATPase and Fis domain
MLSQRIHHLSPRRDGPFIEVNCASLNETLLESELFGHAKGAFTGAETDRVGKLVEAQKGTFLLDDISAASLGMQAKLLHVFEKKTIQPVGSNKNIHLDVRFICASNKNMRAEVDKGRFREDLYYRVYVINIDLPPLKDRKEDILPLIEFFLTYFSQKYSQPKKRLTKESKRLALSYHWPGNVRELRNVLARSVMLSKGKYVVLHLLNSYSVNGFKVNLPAHKNMTLSAAISDYEKTILYNTLKELHWDYPSVCRKLGISRSTLFNKKKKFCLGK